MAAVRFHHERLACDHEAQILLARITIRVAQRSAGKFGNRAFMCDQPQRAAWVQLRRQVVDSVDENVESLPWGDIRWVGGIQQNKVNDFPEEFSPKVPIVQPASGDVFLEKVGDVLLIMPVVH